MKRRTLPKLPKMFQIKFEKHDGKIQYLGFAGYTSDTGKIKYNPILVSKRQNASHFIGFEHTKDIARKFKAKYDFKDVSVIEETSKKETFIQ